ncbi:MAG TPA: fused MFS/spermidine synthase [Candidatus Limnocylindria bacterium]|nr:fused MFS/spermidine synthase [Candidatus Limnocylindria bacterium]
MTAGTTWLARASVPAIVGARSSRWLFVAALSLSSFLMFTLELLAGRVVLPVFGGAPGVWATALCFFTAMLFIGYSYAHVLVARLDSGRATTVHLAVAAVLVVATLLAPTNAANLRDASMPEALNVLLALLVIAGPPSFLLASTTPLLSSWFAGEAHDAWWLYAASNAASLLALVAYPFAVEPFMPLSLQWVALRTGLLVFVGVLAVIALSRRAAAPDVPATASPTATKRTAALGRRRIARWLFLAFVPAGLLTATTSFLTTDLVSAPLIWIGPLAIYLASFVVAFSERGRRFLPVVDRLVPAAATLLWLPYVAPVGWPVVPLLVIVLGSFAVLATAVHGRLALSRPGSEHLTHFYLLLSLAGVLATAIVGVAAPMLLLDIYEYPALLVLALIALAIANRHSITDVIRQPGDAARDLVARLIPYVAVGALLVAFTGTADPGVMALLMLGGMVVACALTPRILVPTTIAAMLAALVALTATPGATQLFIGRSFFGVSKVVNVDGQHRLYSGTTLHGVQLADAGANLATTYYVGSGPLGDVFADLRTRTTGASIGVVGLGAGVVAAYTESADRLTYFEIDPLVVQVASDPHYFSYLTDSLAPVDIVLGDGRLTLADQPPGTFDLLVLDAFSSDSVPPHLLTSEAITSYVRVLGPGGVLAFNLSNRYYDLAPAVAATARDLGFDARVREFIPDADQVAGRAATASIWLVVAPSGFDVAGWSVVTQPGPVLTDDYPDLLRVLRLR